MTNQSFEENNFRALSNNNPDRMREIARSGGVASGVSRRKNKQQREVLGTMLNVALQMDFATPEELKEFRKWKKNHKKK